MEGKVLAVVEGLHPMRSQYHCRLLMFESILLQMEPCGNRCSHIVRCASKLKANKLCDVPERAGYFYDLIAVTSCGLVVRREEVD